MEIKRIIFATGNEGKMKEVRRIMSVIKVPVVSMKEAGVECDIEENGSSFRENAVIKAEAIRDMTGDMVMADDSGLVVDYMGGAPGIYSARFLGEDTDYDIKNRYIIDQLGDAAGGERSARFVCAIACALPDGRVFTCEETMEGEIAYEPQGENGFGYDPIFFLPEYGCTSAKLAPDEKNSISHRGKALRTMASLLEKEGIFGDGK